MKPVSHLLAGRQGSLRTVDADASVYDALGLLAEHEVGALVVMAGERMVGVMSERSTSR